MSGNGKVFPLAGKQLGAAEPAVLHHQVALHVRHGGDGAADREQREQQGRGHDEQDHLRELDHVELHDLTKARLGAREIGTVVGEIEDQPDRDEPDQAEGERRHELRHQILPMEFATLKKGSAANDYLVEGIVFSGGERWGGNPPATCDRKFKLLPYFWRELFL